MRFPGEALLVLAFGFAGVIFWRLHVARLRPTDAQGKTAATNGAISLGQYAVPPDKQYLLIKPGE